MSRKVTAIDYLVESIFNESELKDSILKLAIQQAKAMEKEQIIQANEDCSTNELGEFLTGEQYYNEIYE